MMMLRRWAVGLLGRLMHLEKFRLDQTQNSRLPIGHYLLSHAQYFANCVRCKSINIKQNVRFRGTMPPEIF